MEFNKGKQEQRIIRYLSFKKDCLDAGLYDTEEIQRLFKINEELYHL